MEGQRTLPGWVFLACILHLGAIFLIPQPLTGDNAGSSPLMVSRVFLPPAAGLERPEPSPAPPAVAPPPVPSRPSAAPPAPEPAVAVATAREPELPPPSAPEQSEESVRDTLPRPPEPATGAGASEGTASNTPAKTSSLTSLPTPQNPGGDDLREEAVPLYASNPPPAYPRIARRLGWQGEVLLRVVVKSDGRVAAVRIEKTSGHEVLDRSAREAVRRWRFRPARQGLRPVEKEVSVPVSFELQRS